MSHSEAIGGTGWGNLFLTPGFKIRENLDKNAVSIPSMSLDRAVSLHRQGALARAGTAYREVLAREPACHEALHGLGLVMHQRGRNEPARLLIENALKLCPNQADYHYHLAEILRHSGQASEAVSRYRRAISLNADEGDYYFGLGNALADEGSTDGCLDAYRNAARRAPNDTEIHNNLGNALADRGELVEALAHLRRAVSLAPSYADAHHNLALVLKDSGDSRQAMDHARRACQLAPNRAEPLAHLGQLLARGGEQPSGVSCYRRALELARDNAALLGKIADHLRDAGEPRAALEGYGRAAELEPNVARYHAGSSHCLIRLNRLAEAEAASERALEVEPDYAPGHGTLAACLQARGEFDRAIARLQRSLELQPTTTDAAYLLAANGGYEVGDEEFSSWLALTDNPDLSDEKRFHLHFALAKVYERRRQYDTAFEHYQRANRIKARRYPFDPDRHADYIDRIVATFTADFFTHRRGFGLSDDRPIFIVGMPRSGSTLVERILAGHPKVADAGEHPEMREIVRELPALIGSDERTPECCREIARDKSIQLARRYLSSLPETGPDAARICDKMLGNFLRLGVIALFFPQARIVHCTRDPLDTCVSCYTQDFAHGLRFTTDLNHLALFYRTYRSLMAHWRAVLPLPMFEVNYESLVKNPEPVSRELVELCGLPWDEQCLSPHDTKRDIATASFWQARQPVYCSSVARWRHYEEFLAPLIENLQSGGIANEIA